MTRGFLVVDKARGITSNQVVGEVKRATGIKKIGHAGTLDPMATGVMVLAIGKVTRLIRYIQDQPKEYYATAQFGVSTDTLDADGAVLSREPMDFTEEDLEAIVPRFIGTISQVPPMVSALKKDGRRLYALAREGQIVEREARLVEVHEMEILSVGAPPYPEVEFRVVCGKGTYVRSLADDMAANGGLITLEDLAAYRVIERAPVRGTYRGYEIISTAPPSSGGMAPMPSSGTSSAAGAANPGMASIASQAKRTRAIRGRMPRDLWLMARR